MLFHFTSLKSAFVPLSMLQDAGDISLSRSQGRDVALGPMGPACCVSKVICEVGVNRSSVLSTKQLLS